MRSFWKWFFLSVLLVLLFFFPGWLPDRMFVMTDFMTSSYPFWKLASAKFPPPKWEPFVFGGLPFWGAPHADSFYPINQLLRMITSPGHAASLTLPIHALLGFVFSYLYLKKVGVEQNWSAALSILYASGLFWASMVFSGHIAKMVIANYIPALFWSLENALDGKFKHAVLVGLFAGLIVLATHAQLTYYIALIAVVYTLSRVAYELKGKNYIHVAKILAFALVAIAVALMIGAPFLFPQYEYMTGFSIRGAEKGIVFSKSWSLDWADLVSVFFGLYSGAFETYWGSNAFKINTEYVGGVLVFLGIAGVLIGERNWRWWALVISAVLLLILMSAKVNPFFGLLYSVVPGIKLFRAQSMAAIPFGFVAFAFAGISLKNLDKLREISPRILLGGVIFALIVLLLGFSLSLKSGPLAQNPQAAIVFKQTSGDRMFALLRTLGVWALVLALLKNRNVKTFTLALSVALVGYAENFLLKSKFLQVIRESERYSPDGIASFFLKNKGVYRVLDIAYKPDDNYLAIFGVQFVGGHHGQQMRSYQEYLGCESFMFNPFACKRITQNFEILDSLNTLFLIAPAGIKEALPVQAERQGDPTLKGFSRYLQKYTEVYDDGRFSILENPDALPRFHLICWDGLREVEILRYDYVNGEYEVEFVADGSCQLVLLENWYPHWRVYLAGKEVRPHRYKGTFMAVDVPSGKNRAVFRYRSPLEDLSLLAYLTGFALVFLLVGVSYIKGVKRR